MDIREHFVTRAPAGGLAQSSGPEHSARGILGGEQLSRKRPPRTTSRSVVCACMGIPGGTENKTTLTMARSWHPSEEVLDFDPGSLGVGSGNLDFYIIFFYQASSSDTDVP